MDIRYHSTNRTVYGKTFREALLEGLATDGGLFMPDHIPSVTRAELESFRKMTYPELAAEVIFKFTATELTKKDILKYCTEAYNFDVPLEKVTGRKYIMRLDRGPTASFKDFAARLMSRLMQHFLEKDRRKLTILTATSGDTGSAVASAFRGLGNINVIILFPKDEVSDIQRRQMTTLGENITIIAVDGKFDHCQDMVKRAFMDPSLADYALSSANSINIGRLLPQAVYYFHAWSKLSADTSEKAVFSVPSGNFGNLTAGIIASRMGLPVRKFIIATNANDEVPRFLSTGNYEPVIPSINCISSAMNVGHPSNLARITELFGGELDHRGVFRTPPDMGRMRDELFGVGFSDEETCSTISDVFRKYKILLEPHGATAWRGVEELKKAGMENFSSYQLFISLETAHPAKFPAELMRITSVTPPLPSSMRELGSMREDYFTIRNDYSELKDLIIRNSFQK